MTAVPSPAIDPETIEKAARAVRSTTAEVGPDGSPLPWTSHDSHSYNASCIVCRGDVAAIVAAAVPVLLAEHERSLAELAVLHAAHVWRAVRRDEVSGMTFHHACKALDQAVAYLNGELDREPAPPPTEEEIEAGRELVRQAKRYSAERGGAWAADQLLARGSRLSDSGEATRA